MILKSAQELASLLTRDRRVLALDVGEKTIGLALSDVSRTIATPFKTLARSKFSKDAKALKTAVEEQNVGALVIGYPINMNGTEGPKCQSIRQFAQNFDKIVAIPILLWDERLSTMAVTRTMLDADLSRKRQAEVVDKMAASYFLQSALDAMKN